MSPARSAPKDRQLDSVVTLVSVAGGAPTQLTSPTRRWLGAACAALMALTYLMIWTTYSRTHVSAYEGFVQVPPGAGASRLGGDIFLTSLTTTESLADQEGREPQISDAGTVWVIAELKVIQHVDGTAFCSATLLGPDRRQWESTTPTANRTLPSYCSSDDVKIGQPYAFELTFVVPTKYADQIMGVAVPDNTKAQLTKVLTVGP